MSVGYSAEHDELRQEFARARVPGPLGTGLDIAAPTIIKYGSQEQKQRWLGPDAAR